MTDAENAVDGLSIFETARSRWLNVTEIITLLTPWTSPLSINTSLPADPPPSGTLLLYDRSVTRNYKADGYDWVRKRNSPKVREDHVKLRVGGQYRVAGCYVHSASTSTFHRRAYHLLDYDAAAADEYEGGNGRRGGGGVAGRGSPLSTDPSSSAGSSVAGGGGGGGASSAAASMGAALEEILERKRSLILLHYLDTEEAAAVSAKFSDRLAAAAGGGGGHGHGHGHGGGKRSRRGVGGGKAGPPRGRRAGKALPRSFTASQKAAAAARQLQEEAMAAIAAAAELQEHSREVAPPPTPGPSGSSDAGGSEDMKSLVGEDDDDDGDGDDPSSSILDSMFGSDGGFKAGAAGDGEDCTLGILWDMVVEDEEGGDDGDDAAATRGGRGGGAIDPPTTGIHNNLTPFVGDSLVSTMEKAIKEAAAATSAGEDQRQGQPNPIGSEGIGGTASGDATLEKLEPAGPGPPGLGAGSVGPTGAGTTCSTSTPSPGPSSLNPAPAGILNAFGPPSPAPAPTPPPAPALLTLQDQMAAAAATPLGSFPSTPPPATAASGLDLAQQQQQQHHQQQLQQQAALNAAALNAAVVLGHAAAAAAALGGASAQAAHPVVPGAVAPGPGQNPAAAVAAAASQALAMAQTNRLGQDLYQSMQQQLQQQSGLQQQQSMQQQLQQQNGLQQQQNLQQNGLQQQNLQQQGVNSQFQVQQQQSISVAVTTGNPTPQQQQEHLRQMAYTTQSNHGLIAQAAAGQQINNVNAYGTGALSAGPSPMPSPSPPVSDHPSSPPPPPNHPNPAAAPPAGQVELPEVVDFTPAEARVGRPGERRAQIVLSTSASLPETPADDAICAWVSLAAFVEISSPSSTGAGGIGGPPPVRHVGLSPLRRLTPFSCKCDVPGGSAMAGFRPGRRSVVLLRARLAEGTDPTCDAVSTAVALYLQARWNAALDGQRGRGRQPQALIGNVVARPTFYRPDAAAGAGGAGGNVQLLSQLSQQMFTFLA